MTEIEIEDDHRSSIPAVRDQGRRALCLPFAASDANAFAHRSTEPLSVEYLAYQSATLGAAQMAGDASGLTFEDIAAAVENHGQPPENRFPYDPTSTEFVRVPPCPRDHYLPLHFSRMQSRYYSFFELLKGLASGRVFILGLRLTQGFLENVTPAIFRYDGTEVGNHAVLAVGGGKLPDGEPAILIRNSWGSGWGDEGHGWITECLVENALVMAAELEVD